MKTRIAPTPSGLVHAGNAWSFLLTWLMARSRGGKIHLRIDDLDAAQPIFVVRDPFFIESLAVLGGIIFGVLFEVAESARAGDILGDLAPFDGL